MKVSILVALHNREKYIHQCVESLLNQTYRNFEIVIIDDGSTDDSVKIINQFSDQRIKLFSKKHQGCWKTKNSAINHSTSDWITFVDSDDFVDRRFIENNIDFIQKNPNHDYYYPLNLRICNSDGKYSNSNWVYLEFKTKEKWKIIKIFFDENVCAIPHAGAFVRKSVFSKLGVFNASLFNFSDAEYIIRNALKLDFKVVGDFSGYYNRQHSQQTNKNKYEKAKSINFILNYIISNFPEEFYITTNNPSRELINKFATLSKNAGKYGTPFMESAKKIIHQNRKSNHD